MPAYSATTETLYFCRARQSGDDNCAGEEFEVQTQLNRGPWFDPPEGERLRKLLRSGRNRGCIRVEGAELWDDAQHLHRPIVLIPSASRAAAERRARLLSLPAWDRTPAVHIENGDSLG